MVIRRKLLCVKKERDLDLGHLLLYRPYKNILANFVDLSTEKQAIDFDPISKAFDGLESISKDIKHYYEALLGITSYYQHSQGGKGKYVEKKISSVMETCSINIKLSELPIWLKYPKLYRKRGIFTQSGLTFEEKSVLRSTEWDWLGDEDESTDIGNLFPEDHSLVLVEIKNRVDSGGTSGRREIWTKKFRTILEILANKSPIYACENKKYSLLDLLNQFNIKKVEIYIGILFNVEGTPATKEGDKQKGFFSSSSEGYRDLKRFLESKPILELDKEDFNNLTLDIKLLPSEINLRIGALYGNEIPKALFHKDYSISDLLILRYDDIWLSQLTAIEERSKLLKNGNNFMISFKNLLKRDLKLRLMYNDLIKSECEESNLNKIVIYLLDKYLNVFEDKLVPYGKNKNNYLADVIQVLCAAEA